MTCDLITIVPIASFTLEWQSKAFDRLTVHELYELMRLSAQKYLERFYQSLGFISEGDDYLDDGIPHVEMYRTKSSR